MMAAMDRNRGGARGNRRSLPLLLALMLVAAMLPTSAAVAQESLWQQSVPSVSRVAIGPGGVTALTDSQLVPLALADGTIGPAVSMPGGVVPNDVEVDAAGNTFVAGILGSGVDSDAWVGKFGPAGTLLWSDTFGEPAGATPPFGTERGSAIGLGPTGQVVVAATGFSATSFTNDVNVRLYTDLGASSSLDWTATYNSGIDDIGVDVVSTGTDVYLGLNQITPFGSDGYLQRFDAGDGALREFVRFVGSETGNSILGGVAVAGPYVYVAGAIDVDEGGRSGFAEHVRLGAKRRPHACR